MKDRGALARASIRMEPSADDYELDYGDADDEARTKPNSKFLNRMLTGVGRTNERIIDTTASRAAQKVSPTWQGSRARMSIIFLVI